MSLTPLLLALAALPSPSAPGEPGHAPPPAAVETQAVELTRALLLRPRDEAQPSAALPDDYVKGLRWRGIGPAAMGGRVVAVSVFEADPSTYWVASASGGLLRTTNNGVTYEHQFDHEATVSIGDVCVAPSDRNVVWVGTGEANPRNSVSFGDGVYKSTDGGKTWKNMGLKQSFQIGKVVVHPTNPDIVYVGALGRLYGPSEERGLFKTSDGGKTWNKVLTIDDKTGVVDIRMHPADPETLLVAAWDRQRDGFDSHRGEPPLEDGYDAYDPSRKWGPGAGIYKTTDGGKTFKKMTRGLPTAPMGRIGLDWFRKDPSVVFAIVDCQKIGMGPPVKQTYLGVQGEDTDAGVKLVAVSDGGPAAKAGLKAGDIIKTVDKQPAGKYSDFVERVQKASVGDRWALTVLRGTDTLDIALTIGERPQAGERGSTKRPFGFWYGGQRENIQDRQGPDGWEYGGVYRSDDGGESWKRVNSVNPRPMYFSQVRVDPGDDQRLYVLGIALYRSQDGGKTFKPDGASGVHDDQHCLWVDPRDGRHMLLGTDGGFYVTYDRMDRWDFHNQFDIGQFYHVAVDSRKPYWVYGGLQDNGSWGGPSRTLDGIGPINESWIFVAGGDGFSCRVDPADPDIVYFTSQDGALGRRNLKTGERVFLQPKAPPGSPPYRFNWSTPFLLSSHNPRLFYAAGNYVFRSLKQGSEAKIISPEISRTRRGSGTALNESPRNPDVLWVGTDDGNLWVTRDGGVKWTNVADKVGLPGPRWVASVEPSRFAEGRCYVAFDGHRSDDDAPYVFVTEDFGETWKSLRGNLPAGPTRVLREDLENADVLYLGTEFGVWASINRGGHWTRINNNLPTVAVHELAQHPTTGEMVAATHGRSLWVLDVTPLRQTTPRTLSAATLFRPAPAVHWRSEPEHLMRRFEGARRFVGDNPPQGAVVFYRLTKPADNISLKVLDYAGKTIAVLPTKSEAGLHASRWDLTRPPEAGTPGPRRREPVPPGTYKLVLTVGEEELTTGLRVEGDPTLPPGTLVVPEEAPPRKRKAGYDDD